MSKYPIPLGPETPQVILKTDQKMFCFLESLLKNVLLHACNILRIILLPSYSVWDRIQISEEDECSHQVTLGVHEPAQTLICSE